MSAPTPPLPRSIGVLLSFLMPGAGHAFVGRPWHAAVIVGVGSLLLLLSAALAPRVGFLPFALTAAYVLLTPVVCVVDLMFLGERAETRSTWLAGFLRVIAWCVGCLALSIVTSLTMRVFLLEAFKIPSGSMTPTLVVGDHVFVDKRATTPARGDLIVFRFPLNREQDFVKRVVALGGDVVQVDADGLPTVNGVAARRCVLGRAALGEMPAMTTVTFALESTGGAPYLVVLDERGKSPPFGPYTVPAGEAFVLGDNRHNSFDSRAWRDGAGVSVPFGDIKGKPFLIWLSFASDGKIAWDRVGSMRGPTLPASAAPLAPELTRCLRELGGAT